MTSTNKNANSKSNPNPNSAKLNAQVIKRTLLLMYLLLLYALAFNVVKMAFYWESQTPCWVDSPFFLMIFLLLLCLLLL